MSFGRIGAEPEDTNVSEDNLLSQVIEEARDGEPADEGNPNPSDMVANSPEGGSQEPGEGAGETQTFTVKIDGQEQQVSLEELLSGYQRQSDYTRKTQQLAEQRRQIEQMMAQFQESQMQHQYANATPEQLLSMNPQMAMQKIQQEMAQIDQEIQQAIANDDIFALPKLQYKQAKLQELAQSARSKVTQSMQMLYEIRQSIPDFDKKAPLLTKWVMEALPDEPLTQQELSYLTNPMHFGRTAVKLSKLINHLYDTVQGGRDSAQSKLKRATPNQLNRPGPSQAGPGRPPGLDTLKKRAVESGDDRVWANYIGELTKSQRKKG